MTKEQRKLLQQKLFNLHAKLFFPKFAESSPFKLEDIIKASKNLDPKIIELVDNNFWDILL